MLTDWHQPACGTSQLADSHEKIAEEIRRLLSTSDILRALDASRSMASSAAGSTGRKSNVSNKNTSGEFASLQLPMEELKRWMSSQASDAPSSANQTIPASSSLGNSSSRSIPQFMPVDETFRVMSNSIPGHETTMLSDSSQSLATFSKNELKAVERKRPEGGFTSKSTTGHVIIDGTIRDSSSHANHDDTKCDAFMSSGRAIGPQEMIRLFGERMDHIIEQCSIAHEEYVTMPWRFYDHVSRRILMIQTYYTHRISIIRHFSLSGSLANQLNSIVKNASFQTRQLDIWGHNCTGCQATTTLDDIRPVVRRQNHRSDQTRLLKEWFRQHESEPYPTPNEKERLAQETGMQIKQVEHWFTNSRKRNWRHHSTKNAV